MSNLLLNLKDMISPPEAEETEEESVEEYVELMHEGEEDKGKITVRTFLMNDFEDIKDVISILREGHTIALVNIRPLKERDIVELKRAINKLKKTCDAIEGEIAGFGEDYIVAVPSFAQIHKQPTTEIREQ